MSVAGGPKLGGIGRSGDSDIVLCMDAHDAGSYPGEPATNYISSVTGWPGSAGTGPATPIALGEFGQLRNLAPIFDTYGLVPYTLSMEMKGNIPGSVYVYMQNGSYTKYSFVALSVNVTTEYQLFTFSNLTPAGPTAAWLANTPTDDRAMLACYTGYGSGRNPTVRNIQLELGAYATPFVESRLPDPYAQGYSARPVSVNLSLNDGSFDDKSPNKLPVTNGWSGVTMPGFGGKFGGNAFYFNGNSYLQYNIGSSGSPGFFGTANYTIDFWHYMPAGTSLRNYATWVSSYTSPLNKGIIIAQYVTSGNYGVWTDGTNWLNTGVTILTDQWAHVAAVRTGVETNECTLYLNGTGILTYTDVRNYTYTQIREFTVGALYDASMSHALEGYMSDVRVCSGTALWTQSFTPPTRRNRNAPVVDLSGSDNGGNFVTKDMTDVATYRDGQVIEPVASAVWDFDGTDDYVNMGDTATLGGLPGLTMQAWARPESGIANYEIIFNKENEYEMAWYGTGLKTAIYTNTTTWWWSSTASSFPTGQWSHVVATWNGTDMKQYINGELKTSQSLGGSSTNDAGQPLYLGRRSTASPTDFWYGKLAVAQIYKIALSGAQIKANFNAQRSRFGV